MSKLTPLYVCSENNPSYNLYCSLPCTRGRVGVGGLVALLSSSWVMLFHRDTTLQMIALYFLCVFASLRHCVESFVFASLAAHSPTSAATAVPICRRRTHARLPLHWRTQPGQPPCKNVISAPYSLISACHVGGIVCILCKFCTFRIQ